MSENDRFRWETAGAARKENIVQGAAYRFTVLTPRLLRMEYAPEGEFVDLPSQMAFYRNFPVNRFTVRRQDGVVMLETDALWLCYQENRPFSADTLSVALKNAPRTVWHYGEESEQLGGTSTTLDEVNGGMELGKGVCARCGYTCIDDSDSMLLSEDGWFALRQGRGAVDCYFFGYGHDYRGCIADFYRLTGVPPLLPDYALGNWWSRYHAYTQEEYCALVEKFEAEKVPLSVAVVDMDWHLTQVPEECRIDSPRWNPGWTGYTWNKELFPDYKGFLQFLRDHRLKTALNLHPAQGVGCHEVMYPEMARACGIDPASRKLVKLDLLSPAYMEKYFDIIHHPYERDGVDFWWMDWQQGSDYWWVHDEDHPASPLEKMQPLWLLNHLHILDIRRSGKRPMFFSRYCGLGAHRYPVGFSGDTVMTWESLDFQPYFTATASNAGYGWWSHDIGGHMAGYRDDELTLRWIQLGVLSPINRLHSSKNPFLTKEPWLLSESVRGAAEDWLRLRHDLFPYLYTMNHRCHTALQPLVQPMYYEYPECEAAYEQKNQYFFGSEFFVAPITEKSDPCSQMGRTKVWFPAGQWFDVFNGFVYKGGKTREVHRSVHQYPVFAKAGAIIPMQDCPDSNQLGRAEEMRVLVFPGADGRFALYEDEGDGDGWQSGAYAVTGLTLQYAGSRAVFSIAAAEGRSTLLPAARRWTVLLRGFTGKAEIRCTAGGEPVSAECRYDAETAAWTVTLPRTTPDTALTVEITADDGELVYDNSFAQERAFRILRSAQMANQPKEEIWNNISGSGRRRKLFHYCGDPSWSRLMEALNEMLALQA